MTTQTAGNGRNAMAQGRIVWTSGRTLFDPKPKVNQNTKQPEIDPKTGEQIMEYGFGLAIPKFNPDGTYTKVWTELYQAMHAEALTLYPSGHIPPGFSMKFKDGDTDVDHKGVPFNKREGYAGHVVVACTTRIPIKFFKWDNGNVQVVDGIKNGDYVDVQLNIKAHAAVGNAKPGLYVNPSFVRLNQPGKEIINTPSGDDIFGTVAPSYAGTVVAHEIPAMPMMGQPHAAPAGYPAQPPMQPQPTHAPAGMPGGYPAQPAPGMMPGQPVPAAQPHYGVLPGNMQPQPPHAPAAMPGQYANPGVSGTPFPAQPAAMPPQQPAWNQPMPNVAAPAAYPQQPVQGGYPHPGMPHQ